MNIEFKCPICGSDKYLPVEAGEFVEDIMETREGHIESYERSVITLGYECGGCTVMFGNPAEFSKANSEKARRAILSEIMLEKAKPQ